MAVFKIEKRVPTVKVTKKLIDSIEKYLVSKREALQADLQLPPDSCRLSISVLDNLGTETISSIEQFRTDRFLDSTTDVIMSFACHWLKAEISLEVCIRFSTTSYLSSLVVLCEANDARELGTGLYQSLSEIVSTCKTSNWKYQWLSSLDTLLLWIILMGSFLWAILLMPHSPNVFLVWGVVTIIFVYFLIGKQLHPYTIFDSSRTERMQKNGDWFQYGLLTFLVFGVLFVLIRRWLLGF